jgi:predicted RNase H-like HicB family nuclease
MQTAKYVHWQDDDAWIGYLEEYPDYWTQGESLDDLPDHLRDLYADLSGGHIPGARKSGELVLA